VDLAANRNLPSLPMRQYGSFHPGSNVGGAGVHWSAVMWRFLPSDFDYVSHHRERYGPDILPQGHSNQDWPVSYADLEPHFTRFEWDTGMSGRTGNLNGEILEGGNPFEGPRSRPYPLPPLAATRAGERFAQGAEARGYHPFVQPSSILSEGYTDMSGAPRAGCVYCGFCTRYGCHVDAKSSALTAHIPMALDTGRYEIRTRCYVLDIQVDNTGLATGVRYLGPDGREHVQPARTVLVSGYTMSNVRLLMLSTSAAHPDGIGNARGQLGRNLTHQIWQTPTVGLFQGERFNTYMGNTSTSHAIYDFAGDVFDHADLGFVGGAQLFADAGERLPIGTVAGHPLRGGRDHRRRGCAWVGPGVQGPAAGLGQLHPDHDAGREPGLPPEPLRPRPELHRLPRSSPAAPDVRLDPNERRLYAFVAQRAIEIMEAMGPTSQVENPQITEYNLEDYQSTHIQGGAIFGTSPDDSVTNRYGQVWDAPNVIVTGAALFPQNPGANPTATVNALAYWTGAAMRDQRYFDSPGELLS
jgi:gluconate 2-dehydrogenase alpha chain